MRIVAFVVARKPDQTVEQTIRSVRNLSDLFASFEEAYDKLIDQPISGTSSAIYEVTIELIDPHKVYPPPN